MKYYYVLIKRFAINIDLGRVFTSKVYLPNICTPLYQFFQNKCHLKRFNCLSILRNRYNPMKNRYLPAPLCVLGP